MTVQHRVSLKEAASGLDRLVEQVREGEEIVLVRDGVEVARIVAPALDRSGQEAWREPGGLEGKIVEVDLDWWKPDDELADLFEGSDSFEGARGDWLKNPT